jgi:hypothetical protein
LREGIEGYMQNHHSQMGPRDRNIASREARTLFLNIIEKLAEFDRAGFSAAGSIPGDFFTTRSAFEMLSYMQGNFSMLTILDRFRGCELAFPATGRAMLGPRLDFREAKTYGDAAQIMLEAMIHAGLPHVPGAYI